MTYKSRWTKTRTFFDYYSTIDSFQSKQKWQQLLKPGHACATFHESRPTGSSGMMHTKNTHKTHVTLTLGLWPWCLIGF